MRILFLVHGFPPLHTSGAENYTFNLAQALVGRGHQVHVLCVGTWDNGEYYWNGFSDEVYEGIHVRRLHLCWHKAPDPNRYLYDNPVTAEHLRGWLQEMRPDVVHLTSCYTLSSSVMQICKDAGLPLVVTLVDFWFLCPSLHLLRSNGTLCDGRTTPWECLRCMLYGAKVYRWPAKFLPDSAIRPVLSAISQRASLNKLRGLRGMALDMAERKRILAARLRQADVIIAPSQFLATMHVTGMGRLPMEVQPHGHDLSWLDGYLERVPDGHLRFCYMGQISHDKGVHILVEAFQKLGHVSDVVLDIWGGLKDQDPYANHIRRLAVGSDRIYLRGRFPRAQLAGVLSEADVVVVPSIWYENNPLVIQEAFAAGIPVIATALGGMSEFVQHEVNGLLFERGNSDELACQMRRIVEDPTLLARLRSGILPVKTIEQEVNELVSIYGRLIGQEPLA